MDATTAVTTAWKTAGLNYGSGGGGSGALLKRLGFFRGGIILPQIFKDEMMVIL